MYMKRTQRPVNNYRGGREEINETVSEIYRINNAKWPVLPIAIYELIIYCVQYHVLEIFTVD